MYRQPFSRLVGTIALALTIGPNALPASAQALPPPTAEQHQHAAAAQGDAVEHVQQRRDDLAERAAGVVDHAPAAEIAVTIRLGLSLSRMTV